MAAARVVVWLEPEDPNKKDERGYVIPGKPVKVELLPDPEQHEREMQLKYKQLETEMKNQMA